MNYEDVFRQIIQAEKDAVGDLAVQRAALLECVKMESGDITFTRSPTSEDIEKLIETFKEIQGQGAIGIARRAFEGRLTASDDLDLPAEIVPAEVKEEDFVSGL